MINNTKLTIIIPTFKETPHIQRLTEALMNQTFRGFNAVIVNSNPADETSSYLVSLKDERFVELPGHQKVYWTEATNIGINWAKKNLTKVDYYMLMNCDVWFVPKFLEEYMNIGLRHPDSLFCPVTRNGARYISSGVRMKSWIMSLTHHYLMGKRIDNPTRFIPVNMLAGRAQLIPAKVIDTIGTPNYRALPHYGADYEFSARARRHGYRLFVYTGVEVELDAKNTGKKSYFKNTSLKQRFGYLLDIRSPMNLKYRFNFTRIAYPKHTRVIGLITLLLKTLMEALFGRSAHRLARPKRVKG